MYVDFTVVFATATLVGTLVVCAGTIIAIRMEPRAPNAKPEEEDA